jgi:hypothetical protein
MNKKEPALKSSLFMTCDFFSMEAWKNHTEDSRPVAFS